MKRIKEWLENLKKWWSIPLYRGLMKIAFWILFFVVIFAFIRISSQIKKSSYDTNNESELIEKKDENDITGYIYNYQIINDVNTINISGTYYNGIDLFNYDNNRYYLKDNKYYLVDNNNEVSFNYWMNEFQYHNIFNLVKGKDFESKTEYKDGSIEKVYIIDSLSYNNYYNKHYETDGNIVIKIKEYNNYYSNVIIDYSSYLVNYNNYQVLINYSNVNNINGLDIEISR